MGGSSSNYELPQTPQAIPAPPPPPAPIPVSEAIAKNDTKVQTIEERIKVARKSSATSVTGGNRTQETRGTTRKTSLTGVDTFGVSGVLGS